MSKQKASDMQKRYFNCRDPPVELGFLGSDFVLYRMIGPYLHILLEVFKTCTS